MPAKSDGTEARFIFRGTVKKTKAATMREVPVSEKTAVVRVDEVLQAPEALAHYAGQDITVELGSRQKLRVGQQAVFRTNGWILGKSLAVRSIGLQTAARRAKARASRPSDAVQQLHLKDVKTRAGGADLVISGRVTQVRLPEQAPISQGRPGDRRAPISEHDPLWREAVIEVQAVHKGREKSKKLVVRFPSSTDVRWQQAPKFQPGQEGIFILRRHPQSEAAAASVAVRAATIAPADTYTALHSADFQPASHAKGVQAAIEGVTS